MKAQNGRLILGAGIISLAALAGCGMVAAQAPAGPVAAPPHQPAGAPAAKPRELPPPPPPRQSILGAWVLNRDESDDPRNRMKDSQDSNGGYGSRRPGGAGWPGTSGGGGYGGRRAGMGGGESDEERAKMREVLSPPTNITFSMNGAEVDLKDDRDRKRAFMTDGRKLQKSKDDKYQEIAAKWDGNRLVTDEKSPRGGKMSRTFELSEDGRQLYETLNLKMGRNNTDTPFRFVYDIPSQTQ